MADLMYPDIMGTFQRGQQLGLQNRQMRDQEQRRNRLAELSSQAYGAPADQQQGYVQQAIATDPGAGFALSENLGSVDDRRTRTLVNMSKMLTSAPEQARPGLYRQMVPTLQKFGLSELPPEYNEVVGQTAQSIIQAYGTAAGTPASLQEFQAMTAGLPEDEVQRARRINLGLDPRASSAAITYREVEGADGRKRLVAVDPRQVGAYDLSTGATVGSGVPSPSAPQPMAAGGDPFGGLLSEVPGLRVTGRDRTPERNAQVGGVPNSYHLSGQAIDIGRPSPEQRQMIDAWAMRNGFEVIDGYADGHVHLEPARQMASAAGMPGVGGNQLQTTQAVVPMRSAGGLPPPLDYQGGGNLVSMSPGERAAQETAARQSTELSFLPQRQAIETQGAIERERGVGQAKIDVEREQQAPKRIASYRQALTAAGNVQDSIDNALGMLGPMSTGFIGARSRGIEGSPAFNLASEIETVKANLGFDRLQQMRDNSPTGGALGQVAVQELIALQSTVANLDPNQSEEQIRANLGRVKQHYDNWTSAVRQALAEEERRSGQRGQPSAPASTLGGVSDDELLRMLSGGQ